MIVYPAIDLLDGACVRLLKGNFDRKTIYHSNPIEQAKEFFESGTRYLHLVDLEGARSGKQQTETIEHIINHSGLKLQVGGGINNLEIAEKLCDIGADRIVLGSLAVDKPEETKKIIKTLGPQRITIAMDCLKDHDNKYYIHTHAWQNKTMWEYLQFIEFYLEEGIDTFLCTDIVKDGTLTGPSWNLYENILKAHPQSKVIISGGVKSLQDVKKAKKIGAYGLIIGKALYEGHIKLQDALLC